MSVATGFAGVVLLFVLLALRVPVALALIAAVLSGVAVSDRLGYDELAERYGTG